MRNFVCWLVAVCAMNPTAWGADRNVITASAAKSDSAASPVEVREFDVHVDRKIVGTHRLLIKSDGQMQQAELQTDVRVDVIIYAYVFKLRGTETWRNDRLELADMRCEDGGKKRTFTLKTEGSKHEISFNGKPMPSTTSRYAMTTAYWKLPPAQLRDRGFPIANVDTGNGGQAKFVLVGPDTISAGGKSWSCQHYKIDGPSPAELWFDDQDRLIHQKSIESGHLTELKLKQIRFTKDEN